MPFPDLLEKFVGFLGVFDDLPVFPDLEEKIGWRFEGELVGILEVLGAGVAGKKPIELGSELSVGESVGLNVGASVGERVGFNVGDCVGLSVGYSVGCKSWEFRTWMSETFD